MAATKTAQTLQASESNAAAATKTGSAVSQTTTYGLVVTAKITNGATGPTIGCDFILQISHNGSDWKEYSRQTAGVDNDGIYEFVVELPAPVMNVRSVFSGNTAQAVTVESFGHELTKI